MIDLDFGALAPFIAAIFSGLAAFFYGYRKANTNRDVKGGDNNTSQGILLPLKEII